ncbi:TAXI family TRAP transporter solute-binding subunit [Fictibacillus terranigra]|uniref:TAXI family TRAP transporter solute-binding subunit n=1 Tax=Fictibacillus terranigra TaxID=3058424 RepID=A0ABT8EBY1_9BACL|nr:TAXI family TRAP transporter solute-binding subunit [Fictibacillus sp. CENA-BCM004]MDN4075429.1 TAXI family TRAP transporter solute-binding subunit [Fictibacillus sp. CENA-BCM004]
MMKKSTFTKWGVMFICCMLITGMAACSDGESSQNDQSAPATSTASAKAQTINKENTDAIKVTLAGGSVGGFWSGLGQVVSKSFGDSYGGSAATYEPGSGAGNIKLVDENQVELGIIQDVEGVAAEKGIPPFAHKYENMKAIATIYKNATMQIMVRDEFAKKHRVKSLKDIAKKEVPARIAINQQGNLNSLAAKTALESNGITEEKLKKWGGSLTWAGSSQRWDAMGSNRMDVSIDFVFAPDAKVQENEVHTDLQLWSVNQDTVDALKKEWELPAQTIPKGTYDFQKKDVQTVGMRGIILVSDKVNATDQYKMAKSLVDSLKNIQVLHPAMKDMTAKNLADTGTIPLAPGAEAFYKEIGAIK